MGLFSLKKWGDNEHGIKTIQPTMLKKGLDVGFAAFVLFPFTVFYITCTLYNDAGKIEECDRIRREARERRGEV